MTRPPLEPESIPSAEPGQPAIPAGLLRPGSTCPDCGRGRLDYNGLLELECPACGYRLGSGAGCT
jgi:uncharacterized protein (DUF983 family)